MSKPEIDIFKPYLLPKAAYSGGKGRKEVANTTLGKKIYKLSSNENVLGSSPKALEAIRNHIGSLNEYPERTDVKLRKALTDFYKGVLDSNQFVTENSGVSIIEIICRAFISDGLEVIVSNPCFKPYMMFTKNCGGVVVDVPLIEENYELDVDGILDKINDKTRLIFLTNPNNPTGTHLPKQQIDELFEKVPSHVVVVIDEVYFQFADAPDYIRAHHYVTKGRQVIGINSFSKAYGLAGLRLGYAYAPENIATYLRQLNRPFNLSTLSLEAGIAALGDVDFIQKTVEMVQSQKIYLYSELDDIGITYWPSQTNFILIKPSINTQEFESQMLTHGIMVRQVAKFGAPGCVRVTIGDQEANEAFIHALKQIEI